ncbi:MULTISPECIES: hypothetical protein [unclassified Micromonospora]|uniref:hypothetical protein n=1 Tax=unclassified Micromonospora TaxID=2617518 RepID=UPI002FEF84BC
MPVPALVVDDVQIVDEAAPPRVVVEHHVDEAHQPAVVLGEDGLAVGRCGEPCRPHRAAVGRDVAVEERVGEGAPVVPAPTVGVQRRELLGVVRGGESEPP